MTRRGRVTAIAELPAVCGCVPRTGTNAPESRARRDPASAHRARARVGQPVRGARPGVDDAPARRYTNQHVLNLRRRRVGMHFEYRAAMPATCGAAREVPELMSESRIVMRRRRRDLLAGSEQVEQRPKIRLALPVVAHRRAADDNGFSECSRGSSLPRRHRGFPLRRRT